MSDTLVRRLARLDTCAVSDAMDRAGHPSAILGLRPLSAERRIAGRAVTVQLGPARGGPPARHLCTSAVEAAGPGTIIVVAHEGREDVAGWGGLLSLAATIREVEGVVVDGACRDIDESRELDLPVFARSAVPVTARSRIEETGWNIPVKLSGIPVSPGDLILADGSGIVAIPSELAEAVIGIAETIVQKERRMIADVRSGKRISDVMGTDYETMLRKESI